jgi:excisionase family DNA binding protein
MRRVNRHLVKRNRTYSVGELALALGVHKNTIRNWMRSGLAPIDTGRPVLFHGEAVRDFLERRNLGVRRPCQPGTLYCFKCRRPREPALGMVDLGETKRGTSNLQAICGACQTIMYRRVRVSALSIVMPGLVVQGAEDPEPLSERTSPSLSCDFKKRGIRS